MSYSIKQLCHLVPKGRIKIKNWTLVQFYPISQSTSISQSISNPIPPNYSNFAQMKTSIVWFRHDLNIEHHRGLLEASKSSTEVLPLFIFDEDIIDELPKDDARISFIYTTLSEMNHFFEGMSSGLRIQKGKVMKVWEELSSEYEIDTVYIAADYEPYARERDTKFHSWAKSKGIKVHRSDSQVIYPPNAILKNDGTPYLVFTPYAKRWLDQLNQNNTVPPSYSKEELATKTIKSKIEFPSLEELGFKNSSIEVPPYNIKNGMLKGYNKTRDFPAVETAHISTYLRFGLVDIRDLYQKTSMHESFIRELIWREFFKSILFHFPNVVTEEFKAKYRGMPWKHDEDRFRKWTEGKTGYPIVDAGMRELASTGLMHNRVRMITASFLVKHLLIDWRWGEAYFAEKLLDFDLSANNGNWQWVVGSGCDAAPYFRVFNPEAQQKKFDPDFQYIKKWVPEFETSDYPEPIVEHKEARLRALDFYKKHLG